MTLTFITGNPNKLKQTQKYAPFVTQSQALDLPEIQSLDPVEVATVKAEAAFALVQKPILIEDTSVVIECLGRLPGPFIKWFLEELEPVGLCRLADADPKRRAHAMVTYAVHDGQEVHIFTGSSTGTISQEPIGSNGFGWDAVFIPEGCATTQANMQDDERERVSIRRQALEKVGEWLQNQG
jgi:inosine triphosphate pyrophosphatase